MINFTELMNKQESALLDTPIDKQVSYTQQEAQPVSPPCISTPCTHSCYSPCNWIPNNLCDCGETVEAAASLSSPQHSETCSISKEYLRAIRAKNYLENARALAPDGTRLEILYLRS